MSSFDSTRKVWENYAIKNPYWGVLTHDNYDNEHINENSISEFFKSGKKDIDFLESILNNYDNTFENSKVLDFGCGVGRLMYGCARYTSNLTGVDISETYINLAKNNIPNGKFHLVKKQKHIMKLDTDFDIIYSLITLQHNRPKEIYFYIQILLSYLKSGGIALLHIPYNIKNYNKINKTVDVMQMHFLEKSKVKRCIDISNCSLLELNEDKNFCGKDIETCIYVIKKK